MSFSVSRNITYREKKQHKWQNTIVGALIGIVSTLVSATPGLGAERIAFYYPPFGEFTISTDDIETYAESGKVTRDFAFYLNRVPSSQRAQFRQLLRTNFKLNATLVSQVTYSALGESVVRRLSELIMTESRQGSFYALRSALILSATNPKGLNIVEVIRRYPSSTIRLNLTEGQSILTNFSELLRRRNRVVGGLKEVATAEALNQTSDFSQQPDLRVNGSFGYKVVPLEMNDVARSRAFPVDLYLPQNNNNRSGGASTSIKPPFPLIVISHGVAEDRETFAYAAQHLASYGFAVAVLEHPGSDAKKIQQYFAGLASPPEARELINRPLDIKFLLDQLQSLNESGSNFVGQLNVQEVGVIGHSYGGYTGLTLAGATIDVNSVSKQCNPNNSLNLSVLLQCRANELLRQNIPIPSFQDTRVKAVMALNPFGSVVLNQKGFSKIQVPIMFMGGSQDVITPAVPEQVIPFTWVASQNKYLALIENGTHFSTSEKLNASKPVLPVPRELIGPNPAIAQMYVKAFSVAFFQTHLLNQQQYSPYLSAAYAQYISKAPLNVDLVRSLTSEQLEKIFANN
ncbi:MAG: alpha/beta hydrolase [Calothrix sp. FI2-JRJ7]|jgi:predicted dienelactone hydrolase|nr:alpha/beta hydrolase [Calothrix sp. FI2-JRJ7]